MDVVTGAGPIGWAVAEQLAAQGRSVKVVTRSGSGPELPGIERIRLDANDSSAMVGVVAGADAVYHCIHGSKYDAKVWARELPGAERVVLDVAGAAGAVVVFPESLYVFDSSDVMTEQTRHTAPSKKGKVRAELLVARAASGTPTVSVAASDYYGPRAGDSAMAGARMVGPAVAGKSMSVLGNPDLPHSYTYLPDMAAAMIAAAQDSSFWNALWFAPTAPPVTQAEMAAAYARAAGAPVPKVKGMPSWLLRGAGAVVGSVGELAEMLYQWEAPFVMDSHASEIALGLKPTLLDEGAAATVAWWTAAH
jgi:nucleoside-diphosphate-sugar epimerase